MTRTIRFHLDESCRLSIARALRLHGIDVTTAADAQLIGASDADHMAYALDSNRIILTHDSDFLGLSNVGSEHAGIIYCHQGRRSIGDTIRGLLLVWEVYSPEDMHGRIEYL